MKTLSLSLVAFLVASMAFAQAPKIPLLEHFTNTRCSRCPAGNANLFQVLDQNPDKLHHLTIHPSVPYNTCALYLANAPDNESRQNLYNIGSTPQAYLNGTRSGWGTSMLNQTQVDTAVAQTSPVSIQVAEAPKGPDSVEVTVTLTSWGDVPPGSYRLFAAVAEKNLQYNAPNSEMEHHNVLRKMLPSPPGLSVTVPAKGNSDTYTFTYYVDPSWAPSEMYTLAFLQDVGTLEVLNSGTRFDLNNTAIDDNDKLSQISVFPSLVSPATDATVRIQYPDIATQRSIEEIALLDHLGRIIQRWEGASLPTSIQMDDLSKGMYLLHFQTSQGVYSKKLLLQ